MADFHSFFLAISGALFGFGPTRRNRSPTSAP